MKLIIYFSAIFSILLYSYKEAEVAAQGVLPFYGGGPIAYSQGSDDDDIGLLLTVLLLATRNRGGGCCGCCNCGGNNIPVPIPIPIATNNPIIMFSRYDDEGTSAVVSEPKEVINIVNESISISDAEANAATKTNNNNENVADSQSVADAQAVDDR